MINLFVNSALLMLAMAGGQPTQTPPVSETILLRHLQAQSVPSLVHPVSGLHNIVVDYQDNSVSVRGETQAMNTIKAEILALDVQPTTYRLTATVMRYRIGPNGRYSENVVMSPTMTTQDKTLARISVRLSVTTERAGAAKDVRSRADASTDPPGGFALALTPTHTADGSITVLAELQELGAQGEVVRSGRNERRLAPGETARVVGMMDGGDKAVRRRAMKGEAIRDGGPLTGYYVQARADMLDDRGRIIKP